MKPPPGSLCPRSSTKTENSSIRLVSPGAIVRKISVRILTTRCLLRRLAACHADEGQDGEARDHDDRDLAQRVEPAKVDDDHVDDVAAVRDRPGMGAEEVAQAGVERQLHYLQ